MEEGTSERRSSRMDIDEDKHRDRPRESRESRDHDDKRVKRESKDEHESKERRDRDKERDSTRSKIQNRESDREERSSGSTGRRDSERRKRYSADPEDKDRDHKVGLGPDYLIPSNAFGNIADWIRKREGIVGLVRRNLMWKRVRYSLIRTMSLSTYRVFCIHVPCLPCLRVVRPRL